MKVIFKNLGPIKSGEFSLQDLTNLNLIVGPNNSGKTYLTYLIYTFYKKISEMFFMKEFKFLKNISDGGELTITEKDYEEIAFTYCKRLENNIKRELPFIFHTKQEFFKDFDIEITLDIEKERLRRAKKSLKGYIIEEQLFIEIVKFENNLKFSIIPAEKDLILDKFTSIGLRKFLREKNLDFLTMSRRNTIYSAFNNIIKNLIFEPIIDIMAFPAERSGTLLFYKQLLQERSDILREIEINKGKERSLNEISRYSEPINEYIKFLNSSEEFQKLKEGNIYKHVSNEIQKIIGGEVEIQENDIIYKCNNKELNIELVSSTVKSLAGFFLYLKYKAKKGDVIIIDEPELNLHPENQRRLFKLFSFLSKQGISFILSTHSPILINEVNNMLLFQDLKDKEIDTKNEEEEYGLDKGYGLKKENVNIWFLNEGKMELIEKEEEQFNIDTFDEVMGEMYNLNNDLLFKGE